MSAGRALLAASVAASAACGSSTPPPPSRQVTVIPTPKLGADDFEVARVNGHPVWASCVSAQATTLAAPKDDAVTRKAALDQCVAFELLAQAAEARGMAAAPEVAAGLRDAAVNRLVELDFEDRYRTPADIKPLIDAVWSKVAFRMHLIQLRASSLARFIVPKNAPPEVDARAKQLAEKLAAELAGQTGLYPIHLAEAAQKIDAGSDIKLESLDVKPTWSGDLVEPYAKALYAIRDVGETSPAFRTEWGWDVTLWTGGVEAKDSTREEIEAEMFPDLRRRQFQLWTTKLGKQLDVHIEVYDQNVAKLDEHGDDAGSAAAPRPKQPGGAR